MFSLVSLASIFSLFQLCTARGTQRGTAWNYCCCLGACNAYSSKAEAMVHTGQYLLSTMYHAALSSEASSSSICPSYLSPQETPTILFASRHHVAIGNQGSTANVGHGHAVPSKEHINKADSRRKKEVVPVSVPPLSKTGQMLNLILRTPGQVSYPDNRMVSTYLRHTYYSKSLLVMV